MTTIDSDRDKAPTGVSFENKIDAAILTVRRRAADERPETKESLSSMEDMTSGAKYLEELVASLKNSGLPVTKEALTAKVVAELTDATITCTCARHSRMTDTAISSHLVKYGWALQIIGNVPTSQGY